MKKYFGIILLLLLLLPSSASASLLSRDKTLDIEVQYQGKILKDQVLINILSCQPEYNQAREEKTLNYLSDTYDTRKKCYWYVDTLPPSELVVLPSLSNFAKPCAIFINGECQDNTGFAARHHKRYELPAEYRIAIDDYFNNIHWLSEAIKSDYNNTKLIFEFDDEGNITYYQRPVELGGWTFIDFLIDLILNFVLKLTFVAYFAGSIASYFKQKDELNIDTEAVMTSVEDNRKLRYRLISWTAVAVFISTCLKWFVLPLLLPLTLVPYVTVIIIILIEMSIIYYANRDHISWQQAFNLVVWSNITLLIIGFLPRTWFRPFGGSGIMYPAL